MSKKKQYNKNTPPVPTVENIVPPKKNTHLKWLAAILLITIASYLPIFSADKDFTNWDDTGYITEQPLIKSLDGESIKAMFSPAAVVQLNYHPLTILSLAIDYRRAYDDTDNSLSAAPFANTNFIFHLLNTILVFFFLYRLSNKRIWAAVLPALLFGIHPMHVESVAWLSERKDVLYCFFFLLSCITYLRYIDTKKVGFLGLSLILFIASCLSKAMATPLPIVLLLIDYLERRQFVMKLWLEKLPYFAIAVAFGLFTLQIQDKAVADAVHFDFVQRILFASYGLMMYLVKLVAPLNLSAIYPYPTTNSSESLPFIYYITPIVMLALFVVPLLLAKKKNDRFREVLFGIGFYVAMLVLVLQFLSVGQAIIADRYTYLAYIGPFFIAGIYLQDAIDNEKYRNVGYGVAGGFCILFIMLTYQRIPIWNNSRALWADVVAKYPYELRGEGDKTVVVKRGVKTAYKNLGDYYASQQQYDNALQYYNTLAQVGTNDAEVWSNVGNIYAVKNDFGKAANAYGHAIFLDPNNFEHHLKHGLMSLRQNDCKAAVADMNMVIKLKPDFKDAYVIKKECEALLSKQ